MKHLIIVGSLLVSALGVAQAQDLRWTPPPCVPPGGCSTGTGAVDIQTKDQPVAAGTALTSLLTEKITVSIPAVVAMHLHETSWTVDLYNMANCDCYRAGEHNMGTGRDDVYDIAAIMARAGSWWKGDNLKITGNPYSFAGDVNLSLLSAEGQLKNKVTSYPGIVYKGDKVEWKGPIVCFNRKIVEKFANSTNWKVNISVSGVSAGFPKLVLGDMLPGITTAGAAPTGAKFVKTLHGAGANGPLEFTNAQANLAGQTTGGWLDDYILEALVFDGSETAGEKTASVNFKLTGTF